MPPIVLFTESGTGDMPDPRGQGFPIKVYVKCDIGGDCVTRRSRTGFAIFLNGASIYQRRSKQQSCEVITFGCEFIATKQAVEYVFGLRYKIRMMGIPCDNPDFFYGHNKSVLSNTTVPASTLK